jgi:hypothetical protein
MILLTLLHVSYVNGPPYFVWPWRRLDLAPALPGFAVAALFFFPAQIFYERGPQSRAWCLVALSAAALALQWTSLAIASGGAPLAHLQRLVEDPIVTSYFTDAAQIHAKAPDGWLRVFPTLLPQLHLHSINKPPGPILYYVAFLEFFADPHAAATAGGLLLGFLAAVVIPSVYFVARAVGAGDRSSFLTASAMVLCPGFTLFFPEFDQIYAGMAALMVGTWALALTRSSRIAAVGCGALVTLSTLVTFTLLPLGFVLAAMAVERCAVRRVCAWRRALETGAVVIAIPVAAFVLLKLALGFDIVDTFLVSRHNQALLAERMARPYPDTAIFDLWGFALGVGWMPALLFVRRLSGRSGEDYEGERAFLWTTLSLMVMLAAGALLPAEATRLWIFLCPMVLVATGAQLGQWPLRERMFFFAISFLNVIVIAQNMAFLTLAA